MADGAGNLIFKLLMNVATNNVLLGLFVLTVGQLFSWLQSDNHLKRKPVCKNRQGNIGRYLLVYCVGAGTRLMILIKNIWFITAVVVKNVVKTFFDSEKYSVSTIIMKV